MDIMKWYYTFDDNIALATRIEFILVSYYTVTLDSILIIVIMLR